jgi:hypothetical protein
MLKIKKFGQQTRFATCKELSLLIQSLPMKNRKRISIAIVAALPQDESMLFE